MTPTGKAEGPELCEFDEHDMEWESSSKTSAIYRCSKCGYWLEANLW